MYDKTRNTLYTALIALAASLPLLTACGGGEGEDAGPAPAASAGSTGGSSSQGQDCNVLFLLLSLGTLCVDNTGSVSAPSSGSGSGSWDGAGSGSSGSGGPNNDGSNTGNITTRHVRINRTTEYEINDTLDNANPVQFLPVSGDDLAGLEITGSLRAPYDSSDHFVFTPQRSGDYLVYLCAGGNCGEAMVTNDLYVMLYDQSQTTIAHSEIVQRSERIFSVHLEAGLAYYVEVHAFDNRGRINDYRLVIIE